MNVPLAPSRILTMAALVTLTGTLLGGCTTLTPSSLSLSSTPQATEYSSHAEQVFLYESRVANAVLDRIAVREIEESGELDPTLTAADARMAEVCRHLNEAAVTRAEGQAASWDLKIKVLATTGTCEHAAHEVELLLEHTGNSVSTADTSHL